MPRKTYIFKSLIVILFILIIMGMARKPELTKPVTNSSLGSESVVLHDVEGNSIDINRYIGQKAVILNFFATWCPSCRAEKPSMEKLSQYLKNNDNIVLLAINLQESPEEVRRFMRDNNYTFRILLDREGSLARAFRVQGIPTTYLLDADGQIINKVVGAIDWMSPDVINQVEQLAKSEVD